MLPSPDWRPPTAQASAGLQEQVTQLEAKRAQLDAHVKKLKTWLAPANKAMHENKLLKDALGDHWLGGCQ